MSIRTVVVSVLVSILTCAAGSADTLVLRGGKTMETTGPWGVYGNMLRVREADGRPKTILLSIIDYDETLRANPSASKQHARPSAKAAGKHAAEAASQPNDAAWHISAEGIRRLKETARIQEETAARMRAQQELSAEMGSVAPKPGFAGGNAGQPAGAKAAGSAGSSANGGYATKGMEGIARCQIFQDSPSAYSQCLSAY